MNKRTRLMIAGLMLIAVTGASTLAYFTSEVKLNGTGSENLKLSITNGIVNVEAAAGEENKPQWTYDTVSKDEKDRSPDITGFDAKSDNGDGVQRVSLGAVLTGNTITNARPGDALQLKFGQEVGGVISGDTTNFIINNKSNLSIRLRLKVNQTAVNQVSKLIDAGWILKINNEIVGKGDITSEIESISNSISSKIYSPASDISNGSKETINLKVRLELPLNTGNDYQGNENGTITDFNIDELFTIIATQENNPGTTETGTF